MSDQLQDLITYSVTEAAIAEMRSKFMGLRVCGFDDVEGYENCKEARKVVRDARLNVEERRKELKKESLEFGRAVDSRAKDITAKIEAIESHLVSQLRIVDDEKKRREEEAIRAAKAKLNERIELLQTFQTSFNLDEIAKLSDESFDELLTHAETRFNAEKRRKAEEAERLRKLEVEAAENAAKLRAAEEATRAAEAEARKARDELIAAQRAEVQAQEKKIREAEEAERLRCLAEKQAKADADKRAAQEIADRELFEEIKAAFPTLELAWIEIARLRRL